MRVVKISQKWETWQSWNVTVIMEVLHFPKVRLGQIESLVFLAAVLLIYLEIFGACRPFCIKFEKILWIAYTITPSLISYTLGLMHAAPFKNDLFLIWAIFLIMLLGSADSIIAYHIQDNEQWRRHGWQLFIKVMGLGLLVCMYADASTLLTALEVLYYVALVKVIERAWASRMASNAVLQRKTKWIADYLRMEHPKSNCDDEVDLATMKGYTYVVDKVEKWGGFFFFFWQVQKSRSCGALREECIRWDEPEKAKAPDYLVPLDHSYHKVITVEDVWQCGGKLLKERDKDHHLKDLCLSFALFRILSSKYAGYSIPQEVYRKSWKLFQKMIESKDENGIERAFRIIEVELSLVFYQLYTKCQMLFQFGVLKCIKLVLMIIGSCIVASIMTHRPKIEGKVQLATSNGLNIDVMLTTMVIITVIVLEIASHVYFVCLTDWGKVSWICSYVRNESWQVKTGENGSWQNKFMEKLIGLICRSPTRKQWKRKLGQYSLLESYVYRPLWLVHNPGTALFIEHTRMGRNKIQMESLSTEVKSAVIKSIASSGRTELENGKASLRQNEKTMLSWACDPKTQAQVIMIWHIATSMCEYKMLEKPDTGSPVTHNFKIATSLSKYLAYLVAFAPRLLSDHPYVTEYVLDQVIMEARESFSNCTNLEGRIRILQDIPSQQQSETVIYKGAKLGKQLLDDVKDLETIWKVLADFWAELMAYVAPSDNMTAHVEHLAMGGEFVSHIWALLTHGGIKRKSSEEGQDH